MLVIYKHEAKNSNYVISLIVFYRCCGFLFLFDINLILGVWLKK